MSGRTLSAEPLNLFFAALSGLVLLFILAPLAAMYLNCSVADLKTTVEDREVWGSIWLTLWTAMLGTLLFALAAVPFAYLLSRKEFRFKNWVAAVVALPVVIPHSAAGIAILSVVAGDRLLGKAAAALGLRVIDHPLGIILAMSFVSIPFLIHSAREGFDAVPRRLELAALNLGASPGRVFFTIALPLAWRGILSGLILMWARGMSEFGAVVIVAYHPMVAPVLIYDRFGSFGLKYARPAAVLFVSVCLIVFVALRWLCRKENHAERR